MLITVNSTIELVKYFGQIIYKTLDVYDIEVPEPVAHNYAALEHISSIQSSSPITSDLSLIFAFQEVTEMLNESISHLLSGALWLLPAAVSRQVISADHRVEYSCS